MSKQSNNKQWLISVPFSGFVTVLVSGNEPSSQHDAYERALAVIDEEEWNFSKDTDAVTIGEVEYHRKVTEGNCSHAVQNEVDWGKA